MTKQNSLLTGNLLEHEAILYITEAIGILQDSGRRAVEVGAGDGYTDGNVYPLLDHNWKVTFIERDISKYKELTKRFSNNAQVDCINQEISLKEGNRLENLISSFDLLSLDIDGNDYWLWNNIKNKPLVVIIEYNSNWENSITIPYDETHQWDKSQYFGASALALKLLGDVKGYDLVGFTKYRNLYFVRKDINVLPVITNLDICIQKEHHSPMTPIQRKRLFKFPERIRLHLGCGNVYIPGYINIDYCLTNSTDITGNAFRLHPRRFPPESVFVIYASHLLEHCSRWEVLNVLKYWHSLLIPGGILRLAVPDFDKLVKVYTKTGNISDILGGLQGGQDNSLNYHNMVFNESLLKEHLVSAGFTKIKKWNWREVEHYCIDDNSQSYFPHMDKKNGLLTSLNIEGIKPC